MRLSFAQQARRMGYDYRCLRRMCAWAGLPVTVRNIRKATKLWLATDTVAGAARRHGVSDDSLRLRLALLGIRKPAGARLKEHLRVTEEQVQQALALDLSYRKPRQRGAHGRFI